MSIAVNGLDNNPFGTTDVDGSANNYVYTQHRLAFSASYSTGGDTLDLSSVANQIPAGFTMLPFGFIEGNGVGTSQSAGGGYYVMLRGATLSTYKVKIFAAGGSELSAGAYPAAVTGDVVVLSLTWRKLL